jgi:hypothetical protein
MSYSFDAGKKLNVLSFGDEAEDEGGSDAVDAAAAGMRFRSAHETLGENNDSRLQSAEAGVHDAHVAELQAHLMQEQVLMLSHHA